MTISNIDDYRQDAPTPASGGGGGGGDLGDRLRVVEIRIARIETELKHVATKAWVLGGILGGMGVAAGIAVALVKLFLN